jgi:predicted transcriptional regulator
MAPRAKSTPREDKELSAAVAQGKRDIAAGRVYEADAVLDELEELVVSTAVPHPTHSNK